MPLASGARPKPPVKETAIGGTCGGAAVFELSYLTVVAAIRHQQLLRYGTKVRWVETTLLLLVSISCAL